jgi:hypothetical protein
MPADDRLQLRSDIRKGFVPTYRFERSRRSITPQRGQDTLGIVNDVDHAHALHALKTLGVRVLLVATNPNEATVFDSRDQTAEWLADATERGDLFRAVSFGRVS